ncbi:type IX secretion system anionic LPS delivery protein PorZ [Nonlabens ponticola]|uniref:T9SS type A sorting domain-containing protein n=1 Tax=Nonlabens ponticola TaxID=2496866 RepID=A0A3S9MW74_9FLAO|nr:T9SS type A sorting domain-containing protein [Nonlabens ponticola]AZQ43392.1 T9SS type A sorting domain-containing protein [Nonlabens ponticola]
MRLTILFIIASSLLVTAQDFTDSWVGYFSFTEIVDIESSDSQIYAASENAVFIYDIASRKFTTLTTVNGLSGDRISQIHYNELSDQLVIGYENGLIQVQEDDVIFDVVAIRDKQIIDPDRKRINEFLQVDQLLYLATDFGIAIYNLELLEFDDTYFIGSNGAQLQVQSIDIFEGFLYAATLDSGIRRAPIDDPFLIDFMNWTRINTGDYDEVIAVNNQLYATDDDRNLWRLSGDQFVTTDTRLPNRALDAHLSNGEILFTGINYASIINEAGAVVSTVTDFEDIATQFTSGVRVNGNLFIGSSDTGLIRSGNGSTEIILADGPSRNDSFTLTTLPNELWVGYGDYDVFYNPFPLDRVGVSHLIEGAWENFTSDDVQNIASISRITINPVAPDELYLNSMNEGVLQFVDGEATTLFNSSNSSLSIINGSGSGRIRVPASKFDSQGNLWAIASQVDDPLNRRTSSGQWTSFDLSDDFPSVAGSSTTKIDINNNDNIFFGTTGAGLVGFNSNENRYAQLTEGIQQGGLRNNYVGALRIDQSGQLWIGSNRGLRVLFNPNSMFTDNPDDARPIIIEDVNGIPRELLADEALVDIEVDGSNRKWVATADSGVFLFSPTGQETIFQFTKNNSPLPSNSVNDIAIDDTTGLVYFATDNGLVAFKGERNSPPADDLENVFAFPNPVRPNFDGNVTIDGLTERARVKITDIEGNLVFEIVSQGGSVQWDTTSFDGRKVASGVYMLLISARDNVETTVSKLMIIR